MEKIWLKTMPLAAFLGLFPAAIFAMGKTQPAPQGDLAGAFHDVSKASGGVARGLRKREASDKLFKSIEDLRQAFTETKALAPKRKNGDLLAQYCEAAQGMLSNVENNARHSYWQVADESFSQVRKLQEDMEHDFGPTRW